MRESQGAVVWFTGLPASGKTNLAARTRTALRRAGREPVILDSDRLRGVIAPQAGYDEAPRAAFYRALGQLAAMLAEGGNIVLVAATANRRSFRDAARAIAPRFLEVFVDTPLEECRRRDPKHLYAATDNTTSNLPGAGAAYQPPLAPEVVAHGGEDQAAVAEITRRLA